MNDIFIARRAEIEAEAKRRGVSDEALVTNINRVIARRLAIPMTMRAQA